MTSRHGWLAALLAAGLFFAAVAQDPPPETLAADPAAEELLEDELLDAEDEDPAAPAEELPPAPEPDPAAAEGRINATMERFVPSEQISEDRSVSFPNDI